MDKFVFLRSTSPDGHKPILRLLGFYCEKDGMGKVGKKSLLACLIAVDVAGTLNFILFHSVKIGAFSHLYHIGGRRCPTHMHRTGIITDTNHLAPVTLRREGISGLEFDTKGIYLASVTKSGCLTIHDFETLYCLSSGLSPCLEEDETKHLLHLSTRQLDVVRWNPANQDEVACTSMQSNEVLLFDIGYVSSEPVEVLRKRPTITVYGSEVLRGLSDIAFTSIDKSRLLASDVYGIINVWDRRMSNLPCLELATNTRSTINSIQLNVENRIVFGASKHGIIYAWDIRGGRTSVAFQSHKEVSHPPLASFKLALLLEKIRSLKAQSEILSKEIHSIDLDPSCPYQLAFHLDDGWSGVLDTNNFQVTHMHCPPPAWLNGADISSSCSYLRKPSWLPTCSIYAVGSSSDSGVHLLDFYPGPSSACHVDFNEDTQCISEEEKQNSRNKFVPLSEGVTACAAHPINSTIIAGTKRSSLLVISQRRQCHPSN
ncbi:uncharacterized protein LOC122087707 isoform X1 [Macadamia integrifolia]|uniref:uncharacterized protein LOC122087707 isoform X1 n=2 Tax=Macadamia integrifolia TaxID=60698 RepID=UPI001C4E735A|nr:uncharacterized protein LOC122087707 isoform X1 [Macadamia integrifolia]